MIVIIDYGMGNLRSVEKALHKLGYPAVITKDKTAIKTASGIILPGVGSFDAGIKELRDSNFEGAIEQSIAMKKPFLGICLGLQLLFEGSEEGVLPGLDVFKGTSKKFKLSKDMKEKIPHMGWNRIIVKRPSPITSGIESGAMMYFAHSYYVIPEDELIVSATTDYVISFPSVISKDNVFGTQFHPEKCGDIGLKILDNFGKICKSSHGA
ncbi:MAG: imidazole glycerol phosphate synthase subunit HisH [Candidatus Saganbacteria bacterium]|nr:imidazole glycerol phosphate synthase subunit HisH [Candidatus Saganbacteria bacterium]